MPGSLCKFQYKVEIGSTIEAHVCQCESTCSDNLYIIPKWLGTVISERIGLHKVSLVILHSRAGSSRCGARVDEDSSSFSQDLLM